MTCYVMTFEMHALVAVSEHVTALITVQRWDSQSGRSALVTVRNGRPERHTWKTSAVVDDDQARAVKALTPTLLSEGAARVLLRTWGVPDSWCGCGALLPIGAWRCIECSKSIGRYVSGSQSGARRRGDRTIHIGGRDLDA